MPFKPQLSGKELCKICELYVWDHLGNGRTIYLNTFYIQHDALDHPRYRQLSELYAYNDVQL